MAISYGIISLLYKNRTRYSFIFSSIISFLKWRGLETIITSASIMTALSGVFIVSAIEQNIIHNIQGTISKSAPSMYLVDITTSQLPKVKELAGSTFTEYPIIRGRLLQVNQRDLTTSSDRGVTREFNMTYRNNLIDGEVVTSGIWHGIAATTNSVSIEKSFAEQIGGVNLGDTITVFIQGLEVKAKVTSIHEADKSRGTPYFYMVFSPDVLSTFPASYFGTIEGSKEEVSAIRNSIGSIFPNIIPIETGTILEIVNSLLGTIILVVQIIGIPSIILGLMLVLVMTGQSLYERKGDVLILRVFGLKKKMITFLFVAEAGILILVATGISYILAHLIAYILNIYLFSFNLFSFASIPLYISFAILIITIIFSYYVASTIVKTPLRELLAEK
jgi:putative ABC transport system permease protein